MKNLDKANEWLKRAKSNMARAKSGRVSPEVGEKRNGQRSTSS